MSGNAVTFRTTQARPRVVPSSFPPGGKVQRIRSLPANYNAAPRRQMTAREIRTVSRILARVASRRWGPVLKAVAAVAQAEALLEQTHSNPSPRFFVGQGGGIPATWTYDPVFRTWSFPGQAWGDNPDGSFRYPQGNGGRDTDVGGINDSPSGVLVGTYETYTDWGGAPWAWWMPTRHIVTPVTPDQFGSPTVLPVPAGDPFPAPWPSIPSFSLPVVPDRDIGVEFPPRGNPRVVLVKRGTRPPGGTSDRKAIYSNRIYRALAVTWTVVQNTAEFVRILGNAAGVHRKTWQAVAWALFFEGKIRDVDFPTLERLLREDGAQDILFALANKMGVHAARSTGSLLSYSRLTQSRYAFHHPTGARRFSPLQSHKQDRWLRGRMKGTL